MSVATGSQGSYAWVDAQGKPNRGDAQMRGSASLNHSGVQALFAGASWDHNPIHIDTDFARASGHPDVFAHGMLVMGYLGQALSDVVPPEIAVVSGDRAESSAFDDSRS